MFKKNIYVKNNLSPFKISRTKIDLFFDCKRCFYIDQRYGIKRPHGAALVLNNYIVNKFKKNLEILRETQTIIPESSSLIKGGMMPLQNTTVKDWINPFKGIFIVDKNTNMKITASLDDIWTDGLKCYPVIIKSMSREEKEIEDSIWSGYSRQLSLYAYLLRKNNLNIGDMGIIAIVNTLNDDDYTRLNFKFFLFKSSINLEWIQKTLVEIKNLLDNENFPNISSSCKFCNYINNIKRTTL